jgi:uncharacterized membrane protein (UPF0136 family)
MKRPPGFYITLSYAVLLVFFGMIGYKAGGSAMSLVAGSTFGVLLVVASVGRLYRKLWGTYLLWSSMITVTAVFMIRASLTHKPVPIFLSLISLGVFVALLVRTLVKKS